MVAYTTPVFTSLIILVILDYSTEHFILPFEECFLADLCNHTWIPECGIENTESDVQTFLDDCHRHEYNCDNNKDYRKVEMDECENNTTTIATATTTSVTTSTTVPTTTTTGSTTTTTEKPLTTTRTEPMTTTKQPIPTTTEPTIITCTNTTEPTKTIIFSASTKPPPESTLVNHNCSRTPPQETVQKNCSCSIISTTTAIKKPTEITTTVSTTLSTTPTSKTTNATTELTTTPTTEPITTPTTEPVTTPTTEPVTTPTTEPTTTSTTTINVTTIKSSISEPETTKPVSITSINDTVDIKENTIPQNSVTPKLVTNKKSCPLEGCDLPTTWVTTAKGEVRDFFQILREKYGAENVKLLRATTHWPRRVGWTKSYRDPFIFGKHVDSGGNAI